MNNLRINFKAMPFWWIGLAVWLLAIVALGFSLTLNLCLTAAAVALFLFQACFSLKNRQAGHGS